MNRGLTLTSTRMSRMETVPVVGNALCSSTPWNQTMAAKQMIAAVGETVANRVMNGPAVNQKSRELSMMGVSVCSIWTNFVFGGLKRTRTTQIPTIASASRAGWRMYLHPDTCERIERKCFLATKASADPRSRPAVNHRGLAESSKFSSAPSRECARTLRISRVAPEAARLGG